MYKDGGTLGCVLAAVVYAAVFLLNVALIGVIIWAIIKLVTWLVGG